MSFVKGKTGFASGDGGTSPSDTDRDTLRPHSEGDTAPATAEEAGKQVEEPRTRPPRPRQQSKS